jgi:hypothetical protein
LNGEGAKKPALIEQDAPERPWREFDARSVDGRLRFVGVGGANAQPLKDNRLRQLGAYLPNFELQPCLTGGAI